jgi:hypothetical protein
MLQLLIKCVFLASCLDMRLLSLVIGSVSGSVLSDPQSERRGILDLTAPENDDNDCARKIKEQLLSIKPPESLPADCSESGIVSLNDDEATVLLRILYSGSKPKPETAERILSRFSERTEDTVRLLANLNRGNAPSFVRACTSSPTVRSLKGAGSTFDKDAQINPTSRSPRYAVFCCSEFRM